MNLNLDQHISQKFNEDLESIKTEMLEMGGLVETQLTDAIAALEYADSELAEKVLKREDRVDTMEVDIDEACTSIIALRQPAASDLRMVLSVLKSIRDLERIGDEAAKIAEMALVLCEQGDAPRGYTEIRHISSSVREMLTDTLDAFARYDSQAAIKTMRADKKVDLDYKSAIREMITYMMEDPRSISRVMKILWILRSLERIGDHSKNICEHIVFFVSGEDLRHKSESEY
ncbi:MAG: phosphate signaling complex protein PhoU [Pseudomonadales bacterium]